MKTLKSIILVLGITASLSQAAVTIAVKNFQTAAVGVPVLNANATPGPLSGGSISVGYFTGNNFNFSNVTAASIKSAFNLAGTSTTFTQAGLFNTSVTTSITYPDTTFASNNIYVIVGNATTLASSSLIAVFAGATVQGGSVQSVFPTVPSNGTAAASALTTTMSRMVFGKSIASGSFTQPSGTLNGTYAQGVQLISTNVVPEPSALLLGAVGMLGLLRRRRN